MGSLTRVFVIYCGGTIGMMENEFGSLGPAPGYLTRMMDEMDELKDHSMPTVVVKEYHPLVDSSDMGCSDWAQIAKDIEDNYYQFDGFVVLTGTDTMAYTSSALSFMCENLGKPVIITGSMIPVARGYSDARRNLLISIDIAGNSCIPEVCIFFHDVLLRGNRSKKISTQDLSAFQSPNHPPLGVVGTSIQYYEDLHRLPPKKPFRTHLNMDRGVVSMRLIPGFDDQVFSFLESCTSLKALIIEVYGTGNAPSRKQGLLLALSRIIKSGKLVVVVSQCAKGSVNLHAYEVGRKLAEVGCLSGHDMTVEAVATKVGYLFGRGLSASEVKQFLGTDLRGELTIHSERGIRSRM